MGPITRTGAALAATAAVAVGAATLAPSAGTPDKPSDRQPGSAAAPAVSPTGLADAATAVPTPQAARHKLTAGGRLAAARRPVDQGRKSDLPRSAVHQPARGQQQSTHVVGGIVTVPTGAPTSFDPSKFDFTGLCTEEWTGDWTGVSVCNVTWAHYDVKTGELTATIVDTFTGTYAGDHSTGSLTFDETFTGNIISGSGVLDGRIVASSGDPTFRCSSGTVTMPFYFNPVLGYGGYSASWHHGCMTANV